MELESIKVEVDGFGEIELREPLFDEIQSLFSDEHKSSEIGMILLRACAYKDGKRVFDSPVGARLGMKLMKLAPKIMELIGLDESGGEGKP